MIYYISDLHFDSERVLNDAERPYKTVEEMNDALIRNWNSVVSDDDTVYVIGDIGQHDHPIPTQLGLLKGHKHLIRGNHDTGLDNQEMLFQYFETVSDFYELDDGDTHILLSHYPMVYRQRGYMIHGHIHRTKPDLFNLLKGLDRVLNASADINDFTPCTLQTLVENNCRFYQRPLPDSSYSSNKKKKWKAVFKPLPQKK